ncbi:uncharacterized protein LOC121642842 isoform X2 [Melanotaenia boesemani]|uniref:uncharacterized protein LOC121642842 isoform X2 n=1 Tax=Melanotaenia boesemani TaxID=1250792 RepID=UPI001C045BB3|nr:uncharacterized protein LOC121642842 isoform X2 [Melanotaenia boesemani]
MWCFQNPGHEAVVLTELQRQQQCNQFCDTLLKAGALPAGHSHLLEFRDLGACTLLHLVRLLYTGEMAGEGESEKQEAVSAAAKLGIRGLVEVTRSKSRGGGEEEREVGQFSEVGEQTEPVRMEENEGRQSWCRREMRDGTVFLWKERLSNRGKDMWTQTEDLHLNPAPPSPSVASYETIDISALQSLGQTVSHQLVPITLVYPSNDNQTLHPFSTSSVSVEEPTSAGSISVAAIAPSYTSAFPPPSSFFSKNDSRSCSAASHSAGRDVPAAEECEDERFQQFQGNIPEFISYFLNTENNEGTCRGRAGRSQRGKQRARAPRGRGGRLPQMMDVQKVRVGKLQKLFLHRWGMRIPRTGQGGGTVGRKLYVKSREVEKTASHSQRSRSKMWVVSQSGDLHLCSVGSNTQCGRKNSVLQFNQNSLPVGRTPKGCNQSTPGSFSGPNRRFHDTPTPFASSPSLQPSLSHSLLSPPDSNVSPASSLIHTTSPHPPAPPPLEDSPECIDRFLEECMIGLDILPNNTTSSFQCSAPTSSNTSAQNKQQGSGTNTPVLQQQCEGELNEILDYFRSISEHVESYSVREENEINDESSTEASQPYIVLSKCERATFKTWTPHTIREQYKHAPHQVSHSYTSEPQSENSGSSQSHSEAHKSLACSDSAKHTKETTEKTRKRSKRRSRTYMFSMEKKKKKQVSSDAANRKLGPNQKDIQLQQRPLDERSLPPPLVTLQEDGCQSLEKKRPSKTPTGLSSAKQYFDSKQQMYLKTKFYPIRSWLKETNITDTASFLLAQLPNKQALSVANPTGCKQGRTKKNKELCSSSNGEISKAAAQMQPVDFCGPDDQCEKNQERHECDLSVQPQEEVERPAWRGKKRGPECNEDANDDATVTKRSSLCQMTEPACETCIPCSESADLASTPATMELKEMVDVETVSLTNCCTQGKKRTENSMLSEIKQRKPEESLPDEDMESSCSEVTNVEEYDEDLQTLGNKEVEKDRCQSRTPPAPSHINAAKNSASPTKASTLQWTEKWEEDEDIDVTGGSSPVPESVIISWTESSEGEKEEEDEDIDVVGEKADFTTSLPP